MRLGRSTRVKTHMLIGVIGLFLGLASCSSQNCPNGSAGLIPREQITPSSSQHFVILLDRTLSMTPLSSDVVSSFNTLLTSLPSSDLLTLIQFDSYRGVEFTIRYKLIDNVEPLTDNEYQPDGDTPLYDAIAQAITDISGMNNSLPTSVTSSQKIRFAIISDGVENSSVRYSLEETSRLLAEKIKAGWDIKFFGIGPDAASEAFRLGIPSSSVESFDPSSGGVENVFKDIGSGLAGGSSGSAGCK